MASECYWCIAGKPAYGNQLGTMGDPFACCHRCQVFTCGHHGQRDDGIQKFYCFDCDKRILIASAMVMGEEKADEIKSISSGFDALYGNVHWYELFDSLEDFKNRRRGYYFFFEQIAESYIDYNNWSDSSLKIFCKNLPYDAQKLLVAAAILIADTDSQEDLMKRNDTLFLNLKTSLKVPSYG